MEKDSILGLSGWGISYSLRWLASRAIYNHDLKEIKKDPNQIVKLNELSLIQHELDVIDIVLKEVAPALIGLAGLGVGIASLPHDLNIAAGSFTFGISHLIEAGSFMFRYNRNRPRIK